MNQDIDFVRLDPAAKTLPQFGPAKAFDTAAAPERFKRIAQRVKEQDRLFFQQHPQAITYSRAYVPGECWPTHLEFASTTTVTKHPTLKGIRARVSMNENPARSRADQTAGATFDVDQDARIDNPFVYGLLQQWVKSLLREAYKTPSSLSDKPKGDALVCCLSNRNFFKDLKTLAAKMIESGKYEVVVFTNPNYGQRGFKLVNGEVKAL